MAIEVKICGIRTPEVLDAATEGGARYVGFVFYPRSPRAVDPATAAELARRVPTGVRSVGLFVDPTDAALEAVLTRVPLDMIQLSGDEPPARVHAIRRRWGLPVMKAVPVGEAADLDRADGYAELVERLLFDARPPRDPAALPGGNGMPFDWRLMAGRAWPVPWMLAGGLRPDNLEAAVAATGALAVDVSSGVEERPGHKTPERVLAFLEAARRLG